MNMPLYNLLHKQYSQCKRLVQKTICKNNLFQNSNKGCGLWFKRYNTGCVAGVIVVPFKTGGC